MEQNDSEWLSYDVVTKDIFQRDRPALLNRLTGGVAAGKTLNVEFALVKSRRADLLFELENNELFLLDFQTDNDNEMEYRVGVYTLLSAQKYKKKVNAAVLYMGRGRMRMKSRLDAGSAKVKYVLIDIRDIAATTLLKGGPGDWALALLARGGPEKMREILRLAMTLPTAQRDRLIAQIAVLSDLRRLSKKFKMEVEKMGNYINIEENVILKDIRDKGKAEGKAEGIALGMLQGMAKTLRDLLETKFGPLPAWAIRRVDGGSGEQMQLWTRKVLTARSLHGVLDRR